MRGLSAILEFENVEVPEKNILGHWAAVEGLSHGFRLWQNYLWGHLYGRCQVLMERAIEHAKTRIQFKRPLAGFPLVKKKLATIAALTYAMDATTYMTAGLVDNEVEDFMLESAMLKVFASDSLWQILYETMQIYGGRSFFTDEPFERMMRDARLNMIGEGSNEVMRAFIGVVGMRDVGVQLKGVLDALRDPFHNYPTVWGFVKQKFQALKAPRIPYVRRALLPKEKSSDERFARLAIMSPNCLATTARDRRKAAVTRPNGDKCYGHLHRRFRAQ